uniref:Uncharacterized protein n=1 Tax=Anguilla anguilla TaxID=7936 RepID=A0A0E9QPC8_ANGAN
MLKLAHCPIFDLKLKCVYIYTVCALFVKLIDFPKGILLKHVVTDIPRVSSADTSKGAVALTTANG